MRLGILTGIEPGKARDCGSGPFPGYARGGKSKVSLGGESAPDGLVCGDCIGDEVMDEPDDESAWLG